MNIMRRSTGTHRHQPDMTRNHSLWTGIFFVMTFLASIPAWFMFEPVLSNPDYIVSAGNDTRIFWGAFLELVLIIANIATALVLFPIVKRQSEVLALGFVASRIMECLFIAVGILSLLAVVTLREEVGGSAASDPGSLVLAGQSLVAVKDATFLLGPGFVVGVGNGLILGYLMYRSRLVPRPMAMLGLVGGPLIIMSGVAVMFGVIEPGSGAQVLATIPEFFWELSLGVWLIVKGFTPSPLTAFAPEAPAYGLQGAD